MRRKAGFDVSSAVGTSGGGRRRTKGHVRVVMGVCMRRTMRGWNQTNVGPVEPGRVALDVSGEFFEVGFVGIVGTFAPLGSEDEDAAEERSVAREAGADDADAEFGVGPYRRRDVGP